jgi:calcium/calmodulin-dependent protein kinase (CaM kinase) II
MAGSDEADVLSLTQRLLDAIGTGDWQTYEQLCAPDLTALEPESAGQLVRGLAFHKFYFDLAAAGQEESPRQTTMASPCVRLMGDVAVVAYTRLDQRVDASGQPITTATQETRVWQKQGERWRHVHFHRSH